MGLDRDLVVAAVKAALDGADHQEWLSETLERIAAMPDDELVLENVISAIKATGTAAVRRARTELRAAQLEVVLSRALAAFSGARTTLH